MRVSCNAVVFLLCFVGGLLLHPWVDGRSSSRVQPVDGLHPACNPPGAPRKDGVGFALFLPSGEQSGIRIGTAHGTPSPMAPKPKAEERWSPWM